MDDPELIERGRIASVVANSIVDYVAGQQERIVQKLVTSYRAGSLTHDVMMGGIGEIAGLRDLMSNLESDQRRGFTASEREHGKNG